MPATYTLISSNVLASSAASITFSAIPATYTDLVVRVSARGSTAANTVGFVLQMNTDTGANYSYTNVQATGSTAQSINNVNNGYSNGIWNGYITGASATANTFGSAELYIPSYTASQNMSYYGANDSYGNDVKPRELVTEAINLADASANFANYDNDGDGSVDGGAR
jgi:hypothetical protein